MDFQQFKNLNLSEIEKWKHIKFTAEDVERWKAEGNFVDKLYELKMQKLYLEYLKIKLQNMLSVMQDPFTGYSPIIEAENILRRL